MGIRSLYLPACSEPLYRLHYPGPFSVGGQWTERSVLTISAPTRHTAVFCSLPLSITVIVCFIINAAVWFISLQVQLLVSDSDVESYKQIKSDLDVLRQSVEKSELWVYKSKSADEHGKKKNKDDEEEMVTERKNTPKKSPPTLTSSDKQGSAIDLDIGPPLHGDQAEEYKKIKQVQS